MTTLYSSVHHEMMGPLKNNVQIALRLTRSLKDQAKREMAQIMMICSKQVLLHANDLLDLQFLQNGSFRPAYVQGSIYHTILEIVKMLSLTLVDRDVKIIYELNEIKSYRSLSFDKRRL